MKLKVAECKIDKIKQMGLWYKPINCCFRNRKEEGSLKQMCKKSDSNNTAAINVDV